MVDPVPVGKLLDNFQEIKNSRISLRCAHPRFGGCDFEKFKDTSSLTSMEMGFIGHFKKHPVSESWDPRNPMVFIVENGVKRDFAISLKLALKSINSSTAAPSSSSIEVAMVENPGSEYELQPESGVQLDNGVDGEIVSEIGEHVEVLEEAEVLGIGDDSPMEHGPDEEVVQNMGGIQNYYWY